MDGVAHKHPQAAYTGLHMSLQQYWYFVQRATQGLGEDFRPVGKSLKEEFLLTLFLRMEVHIMGRKITGFL